MANCLCCGEPHEGHGAFCSHNCRMRAAYRRRVHKPLSDKEFDKGQPARCEHCRKPFTRYLPHHRFCSDACRKRTQRVRLATRAEQIIVEDGTPLLEGA